jgi:APA family basic amino acid/polyamine antiporter
VIPRSLALGMGAMILIYLCINLAYFYALPFAQVMGSYSTLNPEALPVATTAAVSAFGPVAVGILSMALVISVLGAMNGSILTGARVPYAMAHDGLFFSGLAEVSKKHRVPFVSILVQAFVATALALSGTFDQLTDYVVFAAWIFYLMVSSSLFVFRKKYPAQPGMYRVPFYPVLPIVFGIVSLWLLGNTLWTSPRESITGLIFILSGIPAYLWFRRKKG